MFRAISHQTFGVEDKHREVRLALHKTIQINYERYQCLWISNGTFSEHVENIKSCGVWGTQMELQAASDYFWCTSVHWNVKLKRGILLVFV